MKLLEKCGKFIKISILPRKIMLARKYHTDRNKKKGAREIRKVYQVADQSEGKIFGDTFRKASSNDEFGRNQQEQEQKWSFSESSQTKAGTKKYWIYIAMGTCVAALYYFYLKKLRGHFYLKKLRGQDYLVQFQSGSDVKFYQVHFGHMNMKVKRASLVQILAQPPITFDQFLQDYLPSADEIADICCNHQTNLLVVLLHPGALINGKPFTAPGLHVKLPESFHLKMGTMAVVKRQIGLQERVSITITKEQDKFKKNRRQYIYLLWQFLPYESVKPVHEEILAQPPITFTKFLQEYLPSKEIDNIFHYPAQNLLVVTLHSAAFIEPFAAPGLHVKLDESFRKMPSMAIGRILETEQRIALRNEALKGKNVW